MLETCSIPQFQPNSAQYQTQLLFVLDFVQVFSDTVITDNMAKHLNLFISSRFYRLHQLLVLFHSPTFSAAVQAFLAVGLDTVKLDKVDMLVMISFAVWKCSVT